MLICKEQNFCWITAFLYNQSPIEWNAKIFPKFERRLVNLGALPKSAITILNVGLFICTQVQCSVFLFLCAKPNQHNQGEWIADRCC